MSDNDKKKKVVLTYAEKEELKQVKLQEQIDYKYPAIIPWDMPEENKELLDLITNTIDKFMVFPNQEKYSTIIAMWIIHTHCFRIWLNTPILFIRSPVKGCGKSTLCNILKSLCYRTVLSQRSTSAALDRLASKYDPTIITDNYDQLNKDYQNSITTMYDVGWEVNGCRFVCNSNDSNIVDELPCFCPKIISGLNDLPPTTKTRSIILLLQKNKGKHILPPTAKKYLPLWEEITRKITRWIADNRIELEQIDEEKLMEDCSIDNRQMDIWVPLLSIAKKFDVLDVMTQYAEECAIENGEQSDGWKENILNALKHWLLFWMDNHKDNEYIPVNTLVGFLDEAGIHLEYSATNTPQPNSGRKLSKILEGFGLKTSNWVDGKTERAVSIEELENVFDVYVGDKTPNPIANNNNIPVGSFIPTPKVEEELF